LQYNILFVPEFVFDERDENSSPTSFSEHAAAMTPSSSVSDVDFFHDDVNASLNHRSCFRAAALFEEDTHALKKGKEGITFIASSLSRASPPVASNIVRRRVHSKARVVQIISFPQNSYKL